MVEVSQSFQGLVLPGLLFRSPGYGGGVSILYVRTSFILRYESFEVSQTGFVGTRLSFEVVSKSYLL